MSNEKPTQSMQTNTQNALELQNPLEYTDYVKELINSYFSASLRNPPEGTIYRNIVAEWEASFRAADIPASRLMEIYRVTMQKNPSFFTTGSILETWDEIRLEEATNHKPSCEICNGTKKTLVLDFNTGKDTEVPCHCVGFVGK